MRLKMLAFLAIAAVGLSGCNETPKPNLSLESLGGLKLTAVEVAFTPDADIYVSDAQDEAQARAQAKAEANEPAGDVKAESIALQRERAIEVVRSVFLRDIGSRLHGARPVVARLSVKQFSVPGAGASLMVGAGASMVASGDLVDAKTREVLESRPPLLTLVGHGGGLLTGGIVGGVISAVSESNRRSKYARGTAEALAVEWCRQYAKWLFERG